MIGEAVPGDPVVRQMLSRPTSRFSGPGLAMLAPAAERSRSAAVPPALKGVYKQQWS
jgi:hypothetical protein